MSEYEIIKNEHIKIQIYSSRIKTRKEAIANKETKYLGNSCSKGHDGWRWTGSGNCIICVREKYIKKENPKTKPKCEFRQSAKANGDMYYFTGKPCKHGHIVKRRTVSGYCTQCQNTRVKEQGRDYSLRSKYGIPLIEYDKLFLKQNGVCALCKKSECRIDHQTNKLKALSVDHCHDTKIIRGLLCAGCNMAIGLFKHNPDLLRKAALYCEQS